MQTAITASALFGSSLTASLTKNNKPALTAQQLPAVFSRLAAGMRVERIYILQVNPSTHSTKLQTSSDLQSRADGLFKDDDNNKIDVFALNKSMMANSQVDARVYRSALMPFGFYTGTHYLAVAEGSGHYRADAFTQGGLAFIVESMYLLIIAIPMMWILYRMPLKTQLQIDPLTHLPNRLTFQQGIARIEDPMLILLNIDSFKELNDFYGTRAGDYVLKELAHRCLANMPKDLKLCRLSGDEFAIYGHNSLAHRGYVSLGTTRLEDWLKRVNTEPFVFNNERLYLEITAGVAVVRDNIVEKASMALKAARMESKPFLVYDAAIKVVEEYQHNIRCTSKLRQAIEMDRIIPYFQPIINAKTDETQQYECLVRLWDNGTIMLPREFLSVAHKSKLYPHITRIIMEKSFEMFWDLDTEFSINLTVGDLADRKTRSLLISHLREFPRPTQVILELTSADASENYDFIKTDVSWARSVGAKIAIDNFGAGYLNFQPLLMLPVDYLKIDGSLIEKLDTEYRHQVILMSIIELAHKLNIKTVAESVHSETIYTIVKKLGIDYAQGYYLGTPKARPERGNRPL